jgi:hypothetical protein
MEKEFSSKSLPLSMHCWMMPSIKTSHLSGLSLNLGYIPACMSSLLALAKIRHARIAKMRLWSLCCSGPFSITSPAILDGN